MIGRPLALALALSLALAACVPAPAPPSALQVTAATAGELQLVLEMQRRALLERDLSAYRSTFDLERAGFGRCKQDAFDARVAPPARVHRAEPYGEGYVRAWLENDGGDLERSYFRKVEGRWIQSEPLENELGEARTKALEGFEIRYWAIDDDVADALADGSVRAFEVVVRDQLADPVRPFAIRFYPTRTVSRPENCAAAGTYSRADDHIRFYLYAFTGNPTTLSTSTTGYLVHEGLHWAQEQLSPGIASRLDWWLREGWPDYLGENRSRASKTSAICATPIPTYMQLADGPREDLLTTTRAGAQRYYALANAMIEYLYARFGPDAYRQLLLAYTDGVDPNVNLPRVLGVTPDQFRAGWIDHATKTYC